MVAANLLSQPHEQPLRIVLLDRSRIARGTAYAERGFAYPLNVPAGRMSADSAAPLEFLDFVRRQFGDTTAEDFLPRALYGQYLEWKLRRAERSAPGRARLERLSAEVCAVTRDEARSAFHLQLSDGRRLKASQVVLALGTPAPRELPELVALRGSSAYVHNPWRDGLSVGRSESVLLLGTGPTTVDITLALARSAGDRVQIHALSRHGWLPARHQSASMRKQGVDSEALLAAAAVSMRQLYRLVRTVTEDVQARAGDWRDIIDGIRQYAPLIWRRLALDDRRRFLRHVRTLWDIHRHRLPPKTSETLDQLRTTGQLQVRAGRLISGAPYQGRMHVRWRARGSAETSRLRVDRLINCSGASHDPNKAREPLWRSLLSQDLVSADPLGLGLRTGHHGMVIDAAGGPVDNLYYIGPLLQAEHWECTAVPELRGQAEGLARHLLLHPRYRLWNASEAPVGQGAPSSGLAPSAVAPI